MDGENFMKKKIIFLVIRIAGTVLAFFNLLLFFAMRPCWSGISSTIGYKNGAAPILYYLPVIICILFFVVLIADLVLKAIFKDKNWLHITFLSIGVVFFIVIMVIIKKGAIDYMRFIWPSFFIYLGVLAIIFCLYFLLFIYPEISLSKNKYFKFGVLGLVSAITIALFLNISINRFTYKPVVYAVEDNYQIVFSTNNDSIAWVEIDGKGYYDTYNGSSKKYSKIHKVEVPMNVLDSAKNYAIHARKNIYCGPFGGFLGRDISQSVAVLPLRR